MNEDLFVSICETVKELGFKNRDHVSFNIIIDCFGVKHACNSHENALNGIHEGCIEEPDFIIRYDVYSKKTHELFSYTSLEESLDKLAHLTKDK